MWRGGHVELVGVGVDTYSRVDHLFNFCDAVMCIGVEPKGFAVQEHNLNKDADIAFVLVMPGDIVERGLGHFFLVGYVIPAFPVPYVGVVVAP